MTQPLKAIDAGEVQRGKLITAEYDFTIPDYQRPYTWDKLPKVDTTVVAQHQVNAQYQAKLTRKLTDEWELN